MLRKIKAAADKVHFSVKAFRYHRGKGVYFGDAILSVLYEAGLRSVANFGWSILKPKFESKGKKIQEEFVDPQHHWETNRKAHGIPVNGFIHDMWNKSALSTALEVLHVPGNARVVSIGCGDGLQECWLNHKFPGLRIEARDFPLQVKEAEEKRLKFFPKSRKSLAFSEGTFEKPGLPKKSFDFVYSSDALHWSNNRELALRNLVELIDPNSESRGLMVTFMPEHHWGDIVKIIPPAEVEGIIKKLGLQILHSDGFRKWHLTIARLP